MREDAYVSSRDLSLKPSLTQEIRNFCQAGCKIGTHNNHYWLPQIHYLYFVGSDKNIRVLFFTSNHILSHTNYSKTCVASVLFPFLLLMEMKKRFGEKRVQWLGWFSNRAGMSDDVRRERGIVWFLSWFDHVWGFVLCALLSRDISILMLNQPIIDRWACNPCIMTTGKLIVNRSKALIHKDKQSSQLQTFRLKLKSQHMARQAPAATPQIMNS